MQVKYGVDIPARTKIGPGFKIEHLYGIVLNPDVVIGKTVISTMVRQLERKKEAKELDAHK